MYLAVERGGNDSVVQCQNMAKWIPLIMEIHCGVQKLILR